MGRLKMKFVENITNVLKTSYAIPIWPTSLRNRVHFLLCKIVQTGRNSKKLIGFLKDVGQNWDGIGCF